MNSLVPPPPPAVPVPVSALAVEPRPPLADGESAEGEELVEFEFEPDVGLDGLGVRETREVAERNAADPPPVWTPLVEVIVGAAEASCEPPVDELEELDELDELPLLELDWMTTALPPPPLRLLPLRPLPLRFPPSRGVINEANFSAPVVPVRRMVRSIGPSVTAAVRMIVAAPVAGPEAFWAKSKPRSIPTAAIPTSRTHHNHLFPEGLGAGGTIVGVEGATPGVGTRSGADAPPLILEIIGSP
jgi:hypothetical protein